MLGTTIKKYNKIWTAFGYGLRQVGQKILIASHQYCPLKNMKKYIRKMLETCKKKRYWKLKRTEALTPADCGL